ncbi:MAG: zinc ribbon domain-containing protein [Thermoanaerobaculia bacterium]
MRPPTLRLLVACPECKRQIDASGLAAGSRFHCDCGELLEVPVARGRDAAVVRCSSCGAPREGRALSCTHCGADFTLAEQDLDTICPGCATRIGRRARFCHACGLAIVPTATAGEETKQLCPACGPPRRLTSRTLGEEGLAVAECRRCGGLWIGGEVFRYLEERARRDQTFLPGADDDEPGDRDRPAGDFYRPCPVCAARMNRRNYGRRSGVVLDACARHGLWFDQGELARVLAWIRSGALTRSESLDREEAAQVERMKRFKEAMDSPPEQDGRAWSLVSLGELILNLLR